MNKDKIKFLNDKENPIDAHLVCLSNNLVQITFDEDLKPSNKILLSGFEVLNEHNLENQSGEYYYAYNTVYREIDENTVILSNDESIYAENSDNDYVDTSDDLTTIEGYVPTLEESKEIKINALSKICNQSIVNGVDVNIDGEIEHFSYKDEDQVNIKEIFDLAMQTQVPLYYHADGKSCKKYTVEQIVNIYATNATNKMHHITYFNQLKLYVESLESKDEVNVVEYGDELTGDYLATYNEAMAQAKLGMETLLGGK